MIRRDPATAMRTVLWASVSETGVNSMADDAWGTKQRNVSGLDGQTYSLNLVLNEIISMSRLRDEDWTWPSLGESSDENRRVFETVREDSWQHFFGDD